MAIVAAKRCPRCDQLRPVEAFGPDGSKSDGLASRCRACDAAKHREYYKRRGRLLRAARKGTAWVS